MARQKKRQTVKKPRKDYDVYAILGFNSENDNETGFLAFNEERKDYREKAYKIVHDI